MQELWRGNANAWECDELGHLNVRGAIAKSLEAAAALAESIGMAPRAGAVLIAKTIHVRYLAEIHAGTPLVIAGGPTAISETGLDAAFLIHHAARERVVARLTFRFDHAEPRSGHAFAWPDRMKQALARLKIDPPESARPRGLPPEPVPGEISARRADALGLALIGRGRIGPADCDDQGQLRPEMAMGKLSDSAVHFRDAFPEQWKSWSEDIPLRYASAVLEARVDIIRPPRSGDGYVIRSGLTEAGEKVRKLVHWALDPLSGQPLWTARVVACVMDLQTRRLVPATGAVRAALDRAVIAGL